MWICVPSTTFLWWGRGEGGGILHSAENRCSRWYLKQRALLEKDFLDLKGESLAWPHSADLGKPSLLDSIKAFFCCTWLLLGFRGHLFGCGFSESNGGRPSNTVD